MKCSLCGYEFQETDSKVACVGCPLVGGCHLVRCPNCGYDMPEEPKLVRAFKAWRRRQSEAGRKGRRDSGNRLDC